jgi:probable DNA metabolism protein
MIYLYDQSFEGFLSVVFEIYSRKTEPYKICRMQEYQEVMFEQSITVVTDPIRSDRVWQGLLKKLGKNARQLPFLAFQSGEPGIEMDLYHLIRLAFLENSPVEENYSDPKILAVRNAAQKVVREAHRMMQFVRFQRTLDNIYFAPISPRYDVISMILPHFADRFADQQWLIYDLERDYGFFYDKHTIAEVVLHEKSFHATDGVVEAGMVHEEETAYQSMWKGYCKNISIRERMNLKLQKQHMPKRYWKFLPEMIR